MTRFRAAARLAVLAATACSLSACFDLDQKVAIGRDGAGSYEMRVTADGLVGEGLKDDRDNLLKPNKAVSHTVVQNGKVARSARADFGKLSDLAFDDEAMSLQVTGRALFGLGPSHVRFRRVFLVDRARKERDRDHDSGEMGREVLETFMGGHQYCFAVTVPGSIDAIAPVTVDGVVMKPTVTGDFIHGHTVTWRLPLATALSAKRLTFQVDFSAYGMFADTETRLTDNSKS
jgi:hypothetical protein